MKCAALAGLLLIVVVASSAEASGGRTAASTLRVVALGDSDATGHGDASGAGWVGRYARLLHQKLGVTVVVNNLAQDGKTSNVLLRDVRSDPTTRAAIRNAQIVLFGIGGADLNAGDARFEAGRCSGRACYAGDLHAFGRNFAATVTAVRALRGSKKTALRAITLANVAPGARDVIPPFVTVKLGLYQAESLRASICKGMTRHGGRCIDVLHAFNGPSGTENAYAKGLMNKVDCCYPSGKGQQLMAQLLFQTGLKPVR